MVHQASNRHIQVVMNKQSPTHNFRFHPAITMLYTLKPWCGGMPWALCSTWYGRVWRNSRLYH